jgi:hypothetical protein
MGTYQSVSSLPSECSIWSARRSARLIHLAGQVGVGGHLPAAHVDGLQPGLDLLHGLVAGGGAEGLYRLLALQQLAQPLGTAAGERVLDSQRPPQPLDIVVAVGPLGIHDFGFAGALRPKRLTAEGSVADG